MATMEPSESDNNINVGNKTSLKAKRRGRKRRWDQIGKLRLHITATKGARAYIVGVVDHSYLATRLPLWLTLSSYASTTPVILAVRDASIGRGIGLTCVRSAVRPLGYRPYLCQVDRMTAGDSALPVPGRSHDHLRPHTCVRLASRVGLATSAGQLSKGAMMWWPGHYVSYHSTPREDLLEVPDEGVEDEVLCLAAGSRHEPENWNGVGVDPTEQELGNWDVARAGPTEQELGNWGVAGADPTEQELGNWDVARVDPTKQELGNWNVTRADPTEQELENWDVARADPTESEPGNWNVARADPTEQELGNLDLGFCQG
ncbi:hypothetical protein GW17_00057617 [Ensete ventricosum]|nr:hypothetical protein GW17_00057617 [Ensete ventricosum]